MATFPIQLELGPKRGNLRLDSPNDVQDFVEQERRFWGFVSAYRSQNRNTTVIADFENKINVLLRYLDNIQKSSTTNYNNILDLLTNAYLTSDIFFSHSIYGNLVSRILSELGARGAVGCASTFLSTSIDGTDTLQIQGLIAADGLLRGIGKDARASVQQSLSRVFDRQSRKQDELDKRAVELTHIVDALEIRRHRQFQRALIAGRNARRLFAKEIHNDSTEAIASIKETQKAYDEFMALQAPATYWKSEARNHRIGSYISMAIGICYAVSIICILIGFAGPFLLEQINSEYKITSQWQSSYVILAMALVVLTIAFWIGRLISRVYLSEAHLAGDAMERSVMTQAYLALTKEGKIGDAERVLVLQALFRASSDGIVKDDGAPDVGAVGLASKFLSPPATH